MKECKICGKLFYNKRKTIVTCSKECCSINRNNNWKKERKLGMIHCEVCGVEFSQRNARQKQCPICLGTQSQITKPNRICSICKKPTHNYFKCSTCWNEDRTNLEGNFRDGLYGCEEVWEDI